MEIVNKNTKQFVLTEKEMRALRLVIAPMSINDMADKMTHAYELTADDDIIDLATTLQKVYLEAGIGLNPNS